MLDLYYYFSNKRRLWIYFNDRRPTLEYCISRLIISYNLTFQKLSYQICQKKIGVPPKWENNNDRLWEVILLWNQERSEWPAVYNGGDAA